MYTLGVRREFTARHYLIGGDFGAENSEHGHRYRLEVVLEAAALNHHGFLVDIALVDSLLDAVVGDLQGQTLNLLAPFSGLNPTIERLATIIHQILCSRLNVPGLAGLAVTVWEDEIAWTSYREAL